VQKIPASDEGPPTIDASIYHEMVRFSDSQLHTVSAFLGGVASQEAIKILIKQYTIFNETFIYDGIHGRTQVYK
jgi:amyloid beta precursor protein binding protein 1